MKKDPEVIKEESDLTNALMDRMLEDRLGMMLSSPRKGRAAVFISIPPEYQDLVLIVMGEIEELLVNKFEGVMESRRAYDVTTGELFEDDDDKKVH